MIYHNGNVTHKLYQLLQMVQAVIFEMFCLVSTTTTDNVYVLTFSNDDWTLICLHNTWPW